jgi:hypothetical protein
MRLLAAGFALLALCGAVRAGEQLFELSDGRTLRGEKAGEEGDEVVIAVQAGGMTAKVRLAKSEIKMVRAAPAEERPVVSSSAKPAEKSAAKPSGEAALEIKARGMTAEADEFARVRRLLAAAAQETKSEYAPRGAFAQDYQSAMPGTDTWYAFPEGDYYPWYPMYGAGGYGFQWYGQGHGHGGSHGHGGGHGHGHGGPP